VRMLKSRRRTNQTTITQGRNRYLLCDSVMGMPGGFYPKKQKGRVPFGPGLIESVNPFSRITGDARRGNCSPFVRRNLNTYTLASFELADFTFIASRHRGQD